MERILLSLAAILSGFALFHIPFSGTFLEFITPVTNYIGTLAILVFALVLIYKAVKSLFSK